MGLVKARKRLVEVYNLFPYVRCYYRNRAADDEWIITVPKTVDVGRNAERYLDHLQNQRKVFT